MPGDEDRMEQVNHLVPSETKQRASDVADWGELSEAVRRVYNAFARSSGDADVVRLEAELTRLDTRETALQRQIESLQAELTSVREQRAEIERRIETAEAGSADYESVCDEILASLDSGENIWPTHSLVEKAASVKGCPPDSVIEDIKSRRPELPAERFTEGTTDTVTFSATDS